MERAVQGGLRHRRLPRRHGRRLPAELRLPVDDRFAVGRPPRQRAPHLRRWKIADPDHPITRGLPDFDDRRRPSSTTATTTPATTCSARPPSTRPPPTRACTTRTWRCVRIHEDLGPRPRLLLPGATPPPTSTTPPPARSSSAACSGRRGPEPREAPQVAHRPRRCGCRDEHMSPGTRRPPSRVFRTTAPLRLHAHGVSERPAGDAASHEAHRPRRCGCRDEHISPSAR